MYSSKMLRTIFEMTDILINFLKNLYVDNIRGYIK